MLNYVILLSLTIAIDASSCPCSNTNIECGTEFEFASTKELVIAKNWTVCNSLLVNYPLQFLSFGQTTVFCQDASLTLRNTLEINSSSVNDVRFSSDVDTCGTSCNNTMEILADFYVDGSVSIQLDEFRVHGNIFVTSKGLLQLSVKNFFAQNIFSNGSVSFTCALSDTCNYIIEKNFNSAFLDIAESHVDVGISFFLNNLRVMGFTNVKISANESLTVGTLSININDDDRGSKSFNVSKKLFESPKISNFSFSNFSNSVCDSGTNNGTQNFVPVLSFANNSVFLSVNIPEKISPELFCCLTSIPSDTSAKTSEYCHCLYYNGGEIPVDCSDVCFLCVTRESGFIAGWAIGGTLFVVISVAAVRLLIIDILSGGTA